MLRRALICGFALEVGLMVGGAFYFPLFIVAGMLFLLGVIALNIARQRITARNREAGEAFANRYRLDPP